jgi:hypothetical protein
LSLATDAYEIHLGQWAKQPEISSPEDAREAIELWLCTVEEHDFPDIVNNNPTNRRRGVENRRAVLWALGVWAYEHGTIHPAPGIAELSRRSGVRPGKVSKHLAQEAALKRFVRLVRKGEKGNPKTAERRAARFKMLVDKPLVRENSSLSTREDVRGKLSGILSGDITHRPQRCTSFTEKKKEPVGSVAARGGGAVAVTKPASVPSAPQGYGDANTKHVSHAAAKPLVHNPSSPPSEHAPQGGANDRLPEQSKHGEDQPPNCMICGEPKVVIGGIWGCRSWKDERHRGKRPSEY